MDIHNQISTTCERVGKLLPLVTSKEFSTCVAVSGRIEHYSVAYFDHITVFEALPQNLG